MLSLSDRILRAHNPNESQGKWIFFLFGIVFGVLGVGVLWNTCLDPLILNSQTKSWTKTHAVILRSELKSDDEDSKSLDIHYQYQVSGVVYECSRYNFSESARNFHISAMREVVKKYPVGSSVDVWVNPSNPEDAVLNRDLEPMVWLGALFCIPFLAVGVFGVGGGLMGGIWDRKSRQLRSLAADKADTLGDGDGVGELAEVLRSHDHLVNAEVVFADGSDRLSGVGMLFACLFWNGIVGAFLMVMILGLISGSSSAWFLFFFLIPFEMLGGWLIVHCIKKLTGTRAPDFVFLASSVDPSPSPMDVSLLWVFLGEPRELLAYSHLNFQVCRSPAFLSLGSFFRRNRDRTGFKRSPHSSHLPEPKLSKEAWVSGASITHLDAELPQTRKYEGGIDLKIQWKKRGEPMRHRTFILSKTDTDD